MTKAYVDLTVQGLEPKQSVRAASTASIAALSGPMTIDGVALVAGDRVLVKDQAQAKENGIYVVPAAGAWKRAQDADTSHWTSILGGGDRTGDPFGLSQGYLTARHQYEYQQQQCLNP